MSINPKALAKALALIAWADDKLEVEELKSIQEIFKKYGMAWKEAKPLVESEMEILLDGDGCQEDREEELTVGVLDFGEIDSREIMDDLAALAVADKKVDYTEIDILHQIGKAANLDPVLITTALLKAAKNTNATLNFA